MDKEKQQKNFVFIEHQNGIERELELINRFLFYEYDIKKLRGDFNTANDILWIDKIEDLIKKDDVIVKKISESINHRKEFKNSLKSMQDDVVFFASHNPDNDPRWQYDMSTVHMEELKTILLESICNINITESKQMNIENLSHDDRKIYIFDKDKMMFEYIMDLTMSENINPRDVLNTIDSVRNYLIIALATNDTKEEIKEEYQKYLDSLDEDENMYG